MHDRRPFSTPALHWMCLPSSHLRSSIPTNRISSGCFAFIISLERSPPKSNGLDRQSFRNDRARMTQPVGVQRRKRLCYVPLEWLENNTVFLSTEPDLSASRLPSCACEQRALDTRQLSPLLSQSIVTKPRSIGPRPDVIAAVTYTG